MKTGELNKRIEIWGKVPFINELKENDYKPTKLKTIWAGIIPQTGTLKKGEANTILSDVTTKIKCRYNSGKDIQQDMWIMFHEHRFDIKYILDPYFTNEFLEIFCSEVIG